MPASPGSTAAPPRPSFTASVAANYVGALWTGLIQLLLVPLYVRQLGVEAYGLVGVFATLQAVLQVLDLGLSPAVNREMARSAALGPPGPEQRELVRTLERVYWAVGLLIGLVVTAASPLAATRWIKVEALPVGDVTLAIAFMGLTLAFEWPMSCYRGALLGLERQVTVNLVNMAGATIFGAGAVAIVLGLRSPIAPLFAWRVVVSAGQTLAGRRLVRRALGDERGVRGATFRWSALASIWRFSAGMTGISLTAIALMQVDKVILSTLLPLDQFGGYMLASSIAGVLPMLVGPIFTAAFPRLTALVAAGDTPGQAREFHVGAQLVSVVVNPAAVTLLLFAEPALTLWSGDPALASRTAPVLALLALGTILNSAMVVPYALQLAHGWTRLGLGINTVLVLLMVPYTILATKAYGLAGAASTWPLLNAVYLAVGAGMSLRRLLPGEGIGWLLRDAGAPLLAVVGAAGVARALLPTRGPTWTLVAVLALAGLAAYSAALASSRGARLALVSGLTALRARAGASHR